MERMTLWIGRLAGISGVLLCLVAVAARLARQFWIGGFQSATVFQAGMAAMVLGCLCLLAVLTERSKHSAK